MQIEFQQVTCLQQAAMRIHARPKLPARFRATEQGDLFENEWEDEEDDGDEVVPIDRELLHQEFSFEEDEELEDEDGLNFDYTIVDDLDELGEADEQS